MKVTVRATRNFTAGPYGRIVIEKGSLRDVDIDDSGRFTTTTNEGFSFGCCHLNDGWEVVVE